MVCYFIIMHLKEVGLICFWYAPMVDGIMIMREYHIKQLKILR